MKYTKHFVCFIDILGFKHTILQSCTDNQALEKVFTVLKAIEATKKNLLPTNGMTVNFDNRKLFEFPQKVSMFSDSLIISYEIENPRSDFADLYKIVLDLATYCWHLLLGESVFVRGGLAYGDLFHEDDVCFGPALLEAVQLEKDAIHPRISVSSDIINYKSDKFPYKAHSDQLETNQKIRRTFEYYQREVLSTDLTGETPIHFIDYLWRYLPMSKEAARAIKETVEFNLNQNYNDSVMAKYVWFATWFNSILSSYTSFGMDEIDISAHDILESRCEMPDYLLP